MVTGEKVGVYVECAYYFACFVMFFILSIILCGYVLGWMILSSWLLCIVILWTAREIRCYENCNSDKMPLMEKMVIGDW